MAASNNDRPEVDVRGFAAGAAISRLPHVMSGDALHHLEQLIEGFSGGVILSDPAGTIVWANKAALVMHGVSSLAELGLTGDEYCSRFRLSDERHRRLESRRYPIMRALAGEEFKGLMVLILAES